MKPPRHRRTPDAPREGHGPDKDARTRPRGTPAKITANASRTAAIGENNRDIASPEPYVKQNALMPLISSVNSVSSKTVAAARLDGGDAFVVFFQCAGRAAAAGGSVA